MESIYESYLKEICTNCKNKKDCQKELIRLIDNTIKCKKYEREKQHEGYKQFKGRMANQEKPIMRL